MPAVHACTEVPATGVRHPSGIERPMCSAIGAYAVSMGPVRDLSELDDEELRLLLNDDRLPLSQQIKVIDERRRRAAERRKEEELAELVASSAALGELDDAARQVADAQAPPR